MKKELQNRQIADFSLKTTYSDIGTDNIDQLKRHLLDALGSMFQALDQPTILKLVKQLRLLSDGGTCKVPLLGYLPYDRAAQLYTALIRYPDFMDNFMGKEATCHPSDNIGSLLAAAQYKPASGKDFLTAMAVAYQIECRLIEEIPVMKEGIDHTLMLAYSIVGGISRLFELSAEQTAHALSIAGCSISPMVTSRASYTYEWKGLASSLDALNCVGITLLARQGMTGPIALFEGPKGFHEIFDMKLDYDWRKETFELIRKCVLKRYNAEIHSQATIETVLELKSQHNIKTENIESIDITTFLTAYHIIGSGAYGDRKLVISKEQADHSLFYLVAVALIDGDIYPEQFSPARIKRPDVQELLQKINVNTAFPIHKPVVAAGILDPYTSAYPDKMKTKVVIKLKEGKTLSLEKDDYHGFFTRPFSWDDVIVKFNRLTSKILDSENQQQIITAVRELDTAGDITKLIRLIAVNNRNNNL